MSPVPSHMTNDSAKNMSHVQYLTNSLGSLQKTDGWEERVCARFCHNFSKDLHLKETLHFYNTKVRQNVRKRCSTAQFYIHLYLWQLKYLQFLQTIQTEGIIQHFAAQFSPVNFRTQYRVNAEMGRRKHRAYIKGQKIFLGVVFATLSLTIFWGMGRTFRYLIWSTVGVPVSKEQRQYKFYISLSLYRKKFKIS